MNQTTNECPELGELRKQCNDLQRDYHDLKEEFQAVKDYIDRLRELSATSASNRFAELSGKWKKETRLMSNVTKRAIHPAYQQIIAMGHTAVPLMLQDLATNGPEDWFWALTTITGENPITEDIRGQMEPMTEAWLKWGMMKGLLSDSTPKTKQTSLGSEELVTE